jgi:hypothetical protein
MWTKQYDMQVQGRAASEAGGSRLVEEEAADAALLNHDAVLQCQHEVRRVGRR